MSGGDYVAVAYAVVLVTLLAYVAIISLKLARLERDVDELVRLARARERQPERAEVPVG